MTTKARIALASFLSVAVAACSSTPDLTPNKHVNKRDQDACTKVAEAASNEPNRRNQQAAVAGGMAIGAGLSGLLVTAAVQGAEDSAVETKARNECLAKKGYKMVPVKP